MLRCNISVALKPEGLRPVRWMCLSSWVGVQYLCSPETRRVKSCREGGGGAKAAVNERANLKKTSQPCVPPGTKIIKVKFKVGLEDT